MFLQMFRCPALSGEENGTFAATFHDIILSNSVLATTFRLKTSWYVRFRDVSFHLRRSWLWQSVKKCAFPKDYTRSMRVNTAVELLVQETFLLCNAQVSH